MIAQGISHTAYDTMKEYMLTGAELDGKYQIPMMDRYVDEIPQDTVDFKDSFSRKMKNHRELSINFYIHDCEFEKLWNNPDRYLEHLKCFKSVIAPDFQWQSVKMVCHCYEYLEQIQKSCHGSLSQYERN